MWHRWQPKAELNLDLSTSKTCVNFINTPSHFKWDIHCLGRSVKTDFVSSWYIHPSYFSKSMNCYGLLQSWTHIYESTNFILKGMLIWFGEKQKFKCSWNVWLKHVKIIWNITIFNILIIIILSSVQD